jgi:ABC-2 type transport system permease protein
VNASSESDAIVRAVNSGASALVIVPANFTEALLEFQPARVELYSVFRTYSMVEEVTYSKILSALTTFSTVIVAQRLQQAYPNRSVEGLAVPVMTVPHSVIRGEAYQADPNRVGASVLGSSIMMPMMVMILIIMAGQLAASSVGMEKEQKTLEVLLTLPVKRINILLGKLSGVIVVSMIATVSYLIGFSFYTNSLGISQGGLDLGTVGLSPEPTGLALLCLSLFFSLISALSLSVLLAVFTKDVRSAQSLMGVLYIPVMIPALVLMFTPISTLPLGIQVLMYAIPFTYPTLASAALFTRDYVPIMLGIIYQAVFTFIVLAIAARVFSTERIVTARLDFGRKKKPVEN